MSAKSVSKSPRYPLDVRLRAHAAQVRIIARHAPMSKGTRNRLHAISEGIERLVDDMQGIKRAPAISWTGNPPTARGEHE